MTGALSVYIAYPVFSLLIAVAFFLIIRLVYAVSPPRLQAWHTFIPKELSPEELSTADWKRYVLQETAIDEELRKNVINNGPVVSPSGMNRYNAQSPVFPPALKRDWNRSFILEPKGTVRGVAVFLHGLTDSPYTLRYFAAHYTRRGFSSIGLRIPGHGTVPGALAESKWEHWMEGVRLALREAQKRSGPGNPVHIVGFSNGAALAVKYALDALETSALLRPDRLVLLSPLVGVIPWAYLAGLAALPASLSVFAKAAWLSVIQEFNPFKYNSMHVNAVRQTVRLSRSLQRQVVRLQQQGALGAIPPILTLHSVEDTTVDSGAILSRLYAYLPHNGSEVVLFDVGKSESGIVKRLIQNGRRKRCLPSVPRDYTFTVIRGNPECREGVESVLLPSETKARERSFKVDFPDGFASMPHFALPFPVKDPLYGASPPEKSKGNYGINLGLASRSIPDGLSVDTDPLFRIGSNPFFPYILERLDACIGASL